MNVKFPNIKVRMVGEDGNAFAIIGRVTRALRRAGVDAATVEQFTTEAMSGDYDNVIGTAMRWVDVE